MESFRRDWVSGPWGSAGRVGMLWGSEAPPWGWVSECLRIALRVGDTGWLLLGLGRCA